jgi:hypothetical protein
VATKVTYFWTCQQDLLGGWTESFYNVGNTPPGPFQAAATVSTRAAALRTALLTIHGEQSQMNYIRYSDPATFRNVALQKVDHPARPVNGSGTDTDYVTSALLLRLIGSDISNTYTTNQWIRAMQDGWIDRNGTLHLAGTFMDAFNALAGVLTSRDNGWAMRVINRTFPSNPVVSIDPTTGAVTCPGHGFLNNGIIRIKGAKGLEYANRIWRITYTDTDHFFLQHWTAQTGAISPGAKVFARYNLYTFIPITTVLAVRATSHATGRPSYQRTGRRKTRRK